MDRAAVLLPFVLLTLIAVGCNRGDAAPAEGQRKSAFDLAVGDCLESLGDDEQQEPTLGEANVVPCDQPHKAEVYGVFDYPAREDEPFPGAGAIERYANEQCRGPVFNSYVGIPYERSKLLVLEASPVADTWTQGDREVVCLAYAGKAQLEETIKGAAR